MADILLFGPQNSGKTQLYYSLKGEEYSDPQQTDRDEYKVNKNGLLGWMGFSNYSIYEIGGKDLFLSNKEFLHNSFMSNDRLIFVFNGNELIDEIKNYKQGGYISSMLRCSIMPVLDKINAAAPNNPRDITFIATHEDEYEGTARDMGTEIYARLEEANEKYLKEANGERYPFKKIMRGNLFCLDATDSDQVKKVFKHINKS